jgi:hypothetical protein
MNAWHASRSDYTNLQNETGRQNRRVITRAGLIGTNSCIDNGARRVAPVAGRLNGRQTAHTLQVFLQPVDTHIHARVDVRMRAVPIVSPV